MTIELPGHWSLVTGHWSLVMVQPVTLLYRSAPRQTGPADTFRGEGFSRGAAAKKLSGDQLRQGERGETTIYPAKRSQRGGVGRRGANGVAAEGCGGETLAGSGPAGTG